MKRLSVTLLDSFRLYREADWFTTEMMLERILGEYQPSREMDIGTAFHACIENHTSEWRVNAELYRFHPDDMVEFERHLPQGMLPEIKLATVYDSIEPVQVSGIVDGIHGNWICDHKTSFKPFQVEKYQDSYQWRFYLDMFGCDVFQYNFAQLKEQDGVIGIVTSHFLPLSRYPEMQKDLECLIADFLSFADAQGVYSSLPEYKAAA